MTTRLELHDITKRYPSVVANDSISLTVEPGQIHAVLGENGAGKSTLMKIIYGAVKPDAGRVLWNGQEVNIANPAQARELGIAMVFQHFSLFDTLTVAENIALGLPSDTKLDELARRIEDTAREYGLELEPQRHVHTLSVGECQRVEIVRALLARPQLLILDEPTSVLTPSAVRVAVRHAAQAGRRRLQHPVHQPQARRNPRAVPHLHGHPRRQEQRRMRPAPGNGREPVAHDDRLEPAAHRTRRARRPATPCWRCASLSLPKSHPFAVELQGHRASTCSAGEIVGLAGVSGNGQQELLAALSGEDRRATA